ncbi:MAG: DNA recombination protein RmuC [Salinarimonadaceae bacterium]|nr:MAG: DNA recombination protein RmuC [Salinarimonadaceae bacterium]
MSETAFQIGDFAATWRETYLALACLALLAAFRALRFWRDRRVLAGQIAELSRIQSEMNGRMQSLTEVFGARQGDFARMLAERIDRGAHHSAETLGRLNERLAVIDAAQANLSELTGQVAGLQRILSNKQTRGAFGQGRMEAIVRDGLPSGGYAFQATLGNGTRPDCVVKLPGDPRGLVIDAKFPLEAFTAFREARGSEARVRAAQRVRTDVGAHIRDIAQKYLVAGETQDIAMMFVPAESLHADLQEHFEDIVQRAHRARVMIVSPSLLALAIQVMQGLARDARIREEAQVIRREVGRLVEDVGRLTERVDKLDQHFRQAQDDVSQIRVSAEKIARRGRRVETLEFADEEARDEAAIVEIRRR